MVREVTYEELRKLQEKGVPYVILATMDGKYLIRVMEGVENTDNLIPVYEGK